MHAELGNSAAFFLIKTCDCASPRLCRGIDRGLTRMRDGVAGFAVFLKPIRFGVDEFVFRGLMARLGLMDVSLRCGSYRTARVFSSLRAYG